MRFVRKVLLVLLLGATGAFATTISFSLLPLNTAYGTYNGFATASVDGVPGQLLVCDDYDHTTYVPSGPLTYTLSTLVGSDPLEHARFADPYARDQSIARYQHAALLVDGMLNSSPLLNLTADYQYALWHLFTPTVALPPTSTAQTLLSETALDVTNVSTRNLDIYSRLLIFTPTAEFGSNQEFLAMSLVPLTPSSQHAVPEPSAWVLMSIGAGLLGLASAPRRLRAWVRGRRQPE